MTTHQTISPCIEDAFGVVLRGALSNAVAKTGARWGTLCMKDPASRDRSLPSDPLYLHSQDGPQEPASAFPETCRRCSLLCADHRKCASRPQEVVQLEEDALPGGSNAAISVGWPSDDTLGMLKLRLPSQCCDSDAAYDSIRAAARRVSHQLRRFALARQTEATLKRRALLVGTAESLEPVDEFLERAAQVRLPATIQGELGVEKDFLATALHFAGPNSRRPFIHLSCTGARWTPDELKVLVRRAVGGTLFLDGVDRLSPILQAVLSDLLATEIGVAAGRPDEPAARLIASCQGPLAAAAAHGTFHPVLQAQLDWLSVVVPPLRRRLEDLSCLLAYLFLQYNRADLWLSVRAFESLAAYPWPGNTAELERTAARLALMVDRGLVRREHLALYAPQILEAASPVRLGRKRVPPAVVELAGELAEGRFDNLSAFHPGLCKALRHLAEAGQSRLSLQRLARQVCLSPSHLSQLFHSALGMSFKPFLTLYRVEVARKLFEQDPYASVTRVAESSGFGDLSQLERGFKPIVGCTPRAYRRSLRR